MNWNQGKIIAGFTAIVVTAAGLILAGCATTNSATPANAAKDPAPKTAIAGAAGAKLWAQTCAHCHYVRSPSSYSDAQWDVAMLHMRVRANLTAEEHKEILAFLKSAH